MEWSKILYTTSLLVILLSCCGDVNSQDAAFELPVQLVGFPVIILSVRLTNFLKKLSYSLSPATYRSRSRRQLAADTDPFDAAEVEKYIVGEFGARACVFERVCAHYAARAQRNPKPRWTGQTYSATTSVRPTKRRTSTC
ncbi:uncharacterized protein LOC125230603 isoform X2 [Leguminivora glycinivorella]|uniref:uncharacterized protein LOC125230603 isoform X2 n=1 Tax=Leguminivora glycinivorella TaxID=1035111 RepID=UPI0020104074|nr:uncharacterized protein LOC125230603 isoform X2 [Leguminivora glycinivorella]